MKEMKCRNYLKQRVNLILQKIIANDSLQKTRFEYSLQIENGQLNNNLRLVNYDTFYLPTETELYLKRVNLIKDISLFCLGDRLTLTKFFDIVTKFSQYRLPLHLGLESQNNKDIYLKYYLNFFSLYRKNVKLAQQVAQNILDELNLKIRIKKREIPLFGVTLNKAGKFICHKIYYIYDKNSSLENSGFSRQELDFFNLLNRNNMLTYFDVMERYRDNKLISRKIEIHPKVHRDILDQVCKTFGIQALVPRVQKIIRDTKGRIEAFAIEKGQLTIYIRLLNYGE